MAANAKDREQISIRVPRDLYIYSREIAEKRGVSLNELVQTGLSMIVRDEKQKELYDSFTLLGQDAEEANVDFAFDAQAEVVLRGD